MLQSALSLSLLASLISPILAGPSAPFLPGPNCPEGYKRLRDQYCIHPEAKFSLNLKNALTTIYAPGTDGGIAPVTAHYVSFTVTATYPSDPTLKIPVVNIPVDIVPTEADQRGYLIDPKSGNVVEEKLPAYARHSIKTNYEGSGFIAFAIKDAEEDLRLQKFLIRSEYMDVHKWVSLSSHWVILTLSDDLQR
jgi:hypothetical protein